MGDAQKEIGMKNLIAGLVLSSLSCIAAADTWHVPDDFLTIQDAIDAASNEDTVLVGPGTYYEAIDYLSLNIIVMSTDGPEVTIIDGSNTSASLASLVHCNAPSRLQGFTFQNADGGTPVNQDGTLIVGGGVRILAGKPVIEDCIFNHCHSGYGGGIHCGGSNVSIINCQFLNCSASSNAGGLLVINGLATIEDCHFEENHATLMGGAMHIVRGDGHAIRNTTFYNNSAIDGGGISWQNIETGYPLEITNCSITENYAINVGGGIRSIAGSEPVVFTNSTLCNNAPDEIVGPFTDNGGNTLCVCPADINGNGNVEIDDILVIAAQWGSTGPQGDINQDGFVGIEDLLEAIDTFGLCSNL